MVKIFEGDYCWRETARLQSAEYWRDLNKDAKQWADSIAARAQTIEAKEGDIPNHLRQAIDRSKLALVIGAGVSISCGLPSWEALVTNMARTIFHKSGLLFDEIDKLLATISVGNDLISLSQALTSIVDDTELINVLSSELNDSKKETSPLLRSIGDFIHSVHLTNERAGQPTIVLTFNYDTLIEEQLDRLVIPVVSWDRNTGLDNVKTECVNVIHSHGIIRKPPSASSGIVLTEANYGQAYFQDGTADPLTELLDQDYTPLFVGFSFRDSYVRKVLHQHSIRRGEPVAISVLAREFLVKEKDWNVYAPPDYTQSELIGLERSGVDPGATRARAVSELPFHLARWMLYSIGVEYVAVGTKDELARWFSGLKLHGSEVDPIV